MNLHRVESQLSSLERLVPHLTQHGCDISAQDAARALIRYFDDVRPIRDEIERHVRDLQVPVRRHLIRHHRDFSSGLRTRPEAVGAATLRQHEDRLNNQSPAAGVGR